MCDVICRYGTTSPGQPENLKEKALNDIIAQTAKLIFRHIFQFKYYFTTIFYQKIINVNQYKNYLIFLA